MEEFMSIGMDRSGRRPMSVEEVADRTLIAAILHQSVVDACDRNPVNALHRRSALHFINANNEVFAFYCELLDLEPKYVEEKFCKYIREHTGIKQRQDKPYNRKQIGNKK